MLLRFILAIGFLITASCAHPFWEKDDRAERDIYRLPPRGSQSSGTRSRARRAAPTPAPRKPVAKKQSPPPEAEVPQSAFEDEMTEEPAAPPVAAAPKRSAKRLAKQPTPVTNASGQQQALIAVDGAALYTAPNFDSPIKAYFEKDKKILIAGKTTPGIGGLGVFYRVYSNGKAVGFITDVDVVPQYKTDEFGDPDEKNMVENPIFRGEEPGADPDSPTLYQKFIGASLYNFNYKEEIAGSKPSANTWMYGLKMSGPGTLFQGPPLDFNVHFSFSPPSFYNKFSSASGFFLISDLLLTLPLTEWPEGMFFYGFGPTMVFTNFNARVNGNSLASQDLRIGLSFFSGFTTRVYHRYYLRADVKYNIETTSYPAFGISLQKVY